MPRPRPPPTPTSSTEIKGREHPEMDFAFSLPPPAVSGYVKSDMQSSPPSSPIDNVNGGSNNPQRKRTLSGTTKPKPDDVSCQNVDLPPPPSRARKIIQMKPKQCSDESLSPPVNPSKSQHSSKKKQPSATSAAGRKIARKTAHSIIERRRRSKMNEEFGVLKDMIPACNGVEMHKLAILQAGIEYVRYLQGCVETLQDQKGDQKEDEVDARLNKIDTSDIEEHPTYRRDSVMTATTGSTNPSPALGPKRSDPMSQGFPIASVTYSTSPPPLTAQTPLPSGISPAFSAIHFSPDLRRFSTISSQTANISGKPSPNILPLPNAALPMNHKQGDDVAEADATAALMMLTNDRRGTSRGAMSVKELLSS